MRIFAAESVDFQAVDFQAFLVPWVRRHWAAIRPPGTMT
jgi:hypothetical protein